MKINTSDDLMKFILKNIRITSDNYICTFETLKKQTRLSKRKVNKFTNQLIKRKFICKGLSASRIDYWLNV